MFISADTMLRKKKHIALTPEYSTDLALDSQRYWRT